jgi:hypothetical protein
LVGDGIADQGPVDSAVEPPAPGVRVIIPPRQEAVVCRQVAPSPAQRGCHLLDIQRDRRFAWKRAAGYSAQSHAEKVFARYKRTCGGGLRAQREASQEREAALACQ